jgi:hypothetical protein
VLKSDAGDALGMPARDSALMPTVLFHVTTHAAAAAILQRGFRDGRDTYLTDQEFSGVWLSDRPLDVNEGAEGDAVLIITFSVPLARLAEFEWVEEGKPYREWLVPAEFINKHATVAVDTACR